MFKEKILLTFDNQYSFNAQGKHVRDGLSSALRTGNNLWTCCDERSSLERLTLLENGSFGNHKHFDLNQFLSLPAGTACEIDIEGLGIDQDKFLWLVGSHSLARKKPRTEDPPRKQIKRLAKVKDDPNRYILARIPLLFNTETGDYELVKSTGDNGDAASFLKAGQLVYINGRNQLMESLEDDEHFKSFLKIPGKDNGFDIEGLAVHGEKIFVGIRGPVLRGWAAVLELKVGEVKNGWLELRPDSEGRLYRKHFLHLGGMGVRDLRIINNDLLILAGPTMDLDGTIAVYRWKNALLLDDESITHKQNLLRLFDVPHGADETSGQDKAEGMALLDSNHVLIVFDTPARERKHFSDGVYGCLYELPTS
jgi:hypothetical protein